MDGKKPINVSTSDKITMMLQKQRNNTITEKPKAAKVGKEVMKELYLKSSVDYKGMHVPPKPPRIIGYMLKIGKVFSGKNRRYFEMNPIEGTLIKYMRKEDCPKKPKEIYCIADITGLTRLPSIPAQKFHFFEVFFPMQIHSLIIINEFINFVANPKKLQIYGSNILIVLFHIASFLKNSPIAFLKKIYQKKFATLILNCLKIY